MWSILYILRCNPLSENQVCFLPGRNSNYTYPFVNPSSTLFTSQSIFFIIANFQTGKPEVCIEALHSISCILTNPPCDRESDLPLKICEDSCVAYNTLLSSTTCDSTREDVLSIVGVSAFTAVQETYLNFNCSDVSTYFSGDNDTVFFTDECTELFSDDLKGSFCSSRNSWLLPLQVYLNHRANLS